MMSDIVSNWKLEQFVLQKCLPPVWSPGAFQGPEAYQQLCQQWESWELSRLLKEALDNVEKLEQAKGELKMQVDNLRADVQGLCGDSLRSAVEISRLENELGCEKQKTVELEKEVGKWIGETQDAQSAVRAVLQDVQRDRGIGPDHKMCHAKIQELQAELGVSRGIVAAIQGKRSRFGTSEGEDSLEPHPPHYDYEGDVWGANGPTRPSPYAPLREEVCQLKGGEEEASKTKKSPPNEPASHGPLQAIDTNRAVLWFTPEQLRTVGKMLGPLTKETAVNWLSRAQRLPRSQSGNVASDLIDLVRKCMKPDDFAALPGDVQMGNVQDIGEVQLAVLKVFFPEVNPLVLFHQEKQNPEERPDAYVNRKKMLYQMAGLPGSKDSPLDFDRPEFKEPPEFREPLVVGLTPPLRVIAGGDAARKPLLGLEQILTQNFELQKQAFPGYMLGGKKGKNSAVFFQNAGVRKMQGDNRKDFDGKGGFGKENQQGPRFQKSNSWRAELRKRLIKYEKQEDIDGLPDTELFQKLALHEANKHSSSNPIDPGSKAQQ
ncbi:PREDICTED: uncharacterized protein LOC104496703 [Buceros rhinoceros silvestris]|uniref:uncharacterized protein LOC104496703 n=1 Tax=Buceros rhinoceros silvestris TaxID=175836 RepID=UPI0005282A2F|nr:PREDICTED: uncharacterized protein LOC104496703 [Buceros rhinoceros silvestris]